MKTFTTVLATVMVTVMLVAGGIGAFLLNSGMLTIQKKSTEHSMMKIVDGQVIEAKTWNTLEGVEFGVEASTIYIGE